ncbi:hypothetical protein Dvar_62170 [Desulfosarcina variabilis str. Montpellier]|uniref:DVU_1557 family redox protein n=1 Tax=Desulfosarcina variabilis TaxID=2300 RepID=UPI003AFA45CC
MAADKPNKICQLCQKRLEKQKVDFEYLGNHFFTDLLRCPDCGQVYIPEELVKTRIREVETLLEDK